MPPKANKTTTTKPKRITKKTSTKKPEELTIDDIQIEPEALGETPTTEVKEEVQNEVKEEIKTEEVKEEIKENVNEASTPTDEKQIEVVKPTKSKKKSNRRLVNKKQTTNEKGEKCYEYEYEILDEDGKVISKQTVTNNHKKNVTVKYDENNEDQRKQLIEGVNTFISVNGIKIPDLYKRMNLDSHLKQMIESINDVYHIKLTQKQLREFIQIHILKS
ncbi:hypothetical protein, partial [Methanobrevibacter sp.]